MFVFDSLAVEGPPTMAPIREDDVTKLGGTVLGRARVLGVFRVLPAWIGSRSSGPTKASDTSGRSSSSGSWSLSLCARAGAELGLDPEIQRSKKKREESALRHMTPQKSPLNSCHVLSLTFSENPLLLCADGHLALPVEEVGKLHEVNPPILIDITILHQAVQDWGAEDQVKLPTNILQVLLFKPSLSLLHTQKHTTVTHSLQGLAHVFLLVLL